MNSYGSTSWPSKASREGQRRNEAALAFWRAGLASAPPTMFGTVLAARLRLSTSTVLLAGCAAMVGAGTGTARSR